LLAKIPASHRAVFLTALRSLWETDP
jgi:hypothetical protein